MQALRRGTPLTPEQKESIAPERSHIITVYRELQARRWHAEDLQPLFAKLGAAAFSLAGIAAGKLSWRSGIPMAPFLAAWLVGGACACLHGMG